METLCFYSSPVPPRSLKQSLSTFPLTTSSSKTKPNHHLSTVVITATLTNPIFHKTSTSPPISPPNDTFPFPSILPTPPLMELLPESLSYQSGHLGAVPEEKASGADGVHNAMNYLTKILTAKVYDVAVESPLDYASKLSERLGVHFWLKREDLQPVFSFKLRGAYNMMAKLTREELEKGVICSSAGNHAQGVALSAQRLGCNAVIAMPVTTPEIKWKSVERLGATVVLVGESYDETQAYAKKRAEDEGRTFIPPFDHPEVIAGQGTIGMEIVRQLPASLHSIFVPIGGGGLIAGIAAYVKRVRPEVKIIGVEPYDANAMALSLHHGQRVKLSRVGGFADGVAVKEVGEETFRLCNDLIDGVVLVDRDTICASIKDMFEETRSILEPAGAIAIAGAEAYCKYYGVKDENIVAITSGANMNFDRLRLISQLADVGRRREAILVTCVPLKWGSFKKFYELVSPLNITEFRFRKDVKKEEALILYSVGFHSALQLEDLLQRMESTKLQTLNLTNNDVLKDHVHFLVDGQSHVDDQILCRFMFPERPGALGKFLDTFGPCWSITLVHYRAQGETHADVLVGLQVAASEMDEFKALANSLGYDYAFETDNEALQILFR